MEILHDDIRQTGEIFDNIKQSLLNKGADVGECTAPAELPGIIDSLEFATFDCQAVKDCIDGEFARTAYVDAADAATYTSMKTYTDAKASTTLAEAKAYTDEKVKGGGGSITVDDALSLDSKNPVQNRVVTRALRSKQDTLDGIFFINDGTTVKEVHLNETITLQGGGGGAVTNAEVVLTNAMQAIGTGSDLIYNGATLEASTKVLFYIKGAPVTGFSLALSSNNPSIPSSWNPDASTITVSIANGTNLSSPVLITATATDAETGYSASATFEVFGVPGGKDGTSYNLVLDNYAITGYYQDPDNTKTLVYTPQSLNLRCVEKSASGVKDVSSQDFSVYYAYDTTAAPGAQKISLLAPFIPTPEGHHYISFVLYKDSVLWDAQTVPIIVDGRKGATGDAGTGLTFKTGFQAEATMATDGSAITAVYYPTGYVPVLNDLVVGEVESDGNPTRFDKVQVFQYDGSTYKKYNLTGKDTGVCGVAPGSGHIILWDGSQWIDVGSVRGGYIHQKYANSDTGPESEYISYLDENIAFTTQPGWEKGEFPGRFIGIVVNDQANFVSTVSDYTWCKWEGEDGYGMEQIFQLGGVTPPPAPVQGLIQDAIWYSYDYVPAGWSDFPLTPTSDQPRCWVSTRMLGTNHRREWSTPVVYSCFSEIPTVLTIQNDNINWLINYEGNTARTDIEQCKLNLVTDGVVSDQGYFDFKWRINGAGYTWRGSGEEDTTRGIKLTLKSSGDGSFEVLSRANKLVFDVNVIEVEFKHQASASAPITNHHGAISVTKITADHCYTIFADQEVLNEDPYDNSIAFINDGRGTTIRVLKEEIQGVDTYLTAFPDDLVLTGYLVDGAGDETEVWKLSENDGAPLPVVLNADDWQLPDGNDPDPDARIASLKIVATMSNSLGQSIVCDTEQIIIHKDGADGMDSPYDEFVYFVNDNDGDNMEQNPGLIQLYPTDPVFQQDDYVPTANDGSAYTDHPTGVSHGQTEWYAVRHKVQKIDPSTNRPYLEWKAFEGPFVWSSYGKDGRDGDGVEYVFCLSGSTSVGDRPGLKNDRGWFADHPSGSPITDYDKIHNNPDFLPAVDSSSNEHWEDDVQTVTKELPAQWVAKRRYKQIGSDPAKHWTDFGEPTLWSVYADSSLKADLSNQNMQIGIDADDKLNETFSNDTALSFSFGSTPMTINSVVISGDWGETPMTFTNGGSFPATPTGQLSRSFTVTNPDDPNDKGDIIVVRDPVTDPTLWTFKVQVKPKSTDKGVSIPVSSTISFAITATDVNNDQHVGMANLNIAKVHAGADAEYYELVVNPARVNIKYDTKNKKYVYDDSSIDVRANHVIGSTSTGFTGGEVFYRYDKETTWTSIGAVPATFNLPTDQIHDKITFKFTNAGWEDIETIPIDKELREVKATKEQFAIDVDGKTSYDQIEEKYWKDSIPGDLPKETENKCLYNRTYILYKDGTFDISDFENMGKGITEYIEYYAKTNPGHKAVDTDWPPIEGPDAPTWSQFKSDLTENYDCLWNYEKITYRNGEVRQTDVTLTMQLINGVDAYTLTLSNQSPVFTRGKDVKYTCQGYILGGGAKLKPINCVSSIPYKVGTEFFTGEILAVYDKDTNLLDLNASKAVYGAGTQYSLTELAGPDYSGNRLQVKTDSANPDTITWTYNTEIKDTDTPIFGVIVKYLIGGEPLYQSALLGPSYVSNGRDGLPYIFRGEWKEGKNYYCNDDRVDLVYIVDGDQRKYYRCILTKDGLSAVTDKPGTTGGDTYWKAFKGNYENIATGFLLAEEAYIKKLGVEMLQTKLIDEEGAEQPESIHIEGDSMWVYGNPGTGMAVTDKENVHVQIHSGPIDENRFPSEVDTKVISGSFSTFTINGTDTKTVTIADVGTTTSYVEIPAITFTLRKTSAILFDALPTTKIRFSLWLGGTELAYTVQPVRDDLWPLNTDAVITLPSVGAKGSGMVTIKASFEDYGVATTLSVSMVQQAPFSGTIKLWPSVPVARSFVEIGNNGMQVVRAENQYMRTYMQNTGLGEPSLTFEARSGANGIRVDMSGVFGFDGDVWRKLDLTKLYV